MSRKALAREIRQLTLLSLVAEHIDQLLEYRTGSKDYYDTIGELNEAIYQYCKECDEYGFWPASDEVLDEFVKQRGH